MAEQSNTVTRRRKISSAKTPNSANRRPAFHASNGRHDAHDKIRRRNHRKIPTAPFYGSKVVEIKDLTKVFDFINETALFKGQWQYKQGENRRKNIRQILEETVYPKFDELKAQAIREKFLEAKLVYGYFPCQSEGNDLIIYEGRRTHRKNAFHISAPAGRTARRQNLCLADYFASKDSGKIDVVAFHLVTMGKKASEHSAELFKADNYTDYLLFHGLSVESAEALAEMWHKRIREELGYRRRRRAELAKLFKQGYQGSRYSFGYPACPRLEDQTKLFELLKPERIDVELTEEFHARSRTINFGDHHSSSGGEVF